MALRCFLLQIGTTSHQSEMVSVPFPCKNAFVAGRRHFIYLFIFSSHKAAHVFIHWALSCSERTKAGVNVDLCISESCRCWKGEQMPHQSCFLTCSGKKQTQSRIQEWHFAAPGQCSSVHSVTLWGNWRLCSTTPVPEYPPSFLHRSWCLRVQEKILSEESQIWRILRHPFQWSSALLTEIALPWSTCFCTSLSEMLHYCHPGSLPRAMDQKTGWQLPSCI